MAHLLPELQGPHPTPQATLGPCCPGPEAEGCPSPKSQPSLQIKENTPRDGKGPPGGHIAALDPGSRKRGGRGLSWGLDSRPGLAGCGEGGQLLRAAAPGHYGIYSGGQRGESRRSHPGTAPLQPCGGGSSPAGERRPLSSHTHYCGSSQVPEAGPHPRRLLWGRQAGWGSPGRDGGAGAPRPVYSRTVKGAEKGKALHAGPRAVGDVQLGVGSSGARSRGVWA